MNTNMWGLHATLKVERTSIERLIDAGQAVTTGDIETLTEVALARVYKHYGKHFPQRTWERQQALFKIDVLTMWQHRAFLGRKTA